MALDSGATSAQFEIGRVITRAFSVIGSNAVTFFALAAILTLPILIFTFFSVFAAALGISLVQFSPAAGSPGTVAAIVGGAVIGALIYVLFTNLLQAAITHGTIVSLNGGHASFGDCIATGFRNALPLTGIVLLATLGIVGGLVLFIVPGVLLALTWAVVTPVRVAERTDVFETFRRSSALTRGYRGSIFGLYVIVGVLSFALELVMRPLAGLSFFGSGAGADVPITFVVVTGVVRMISYLIGATMAASVYYELRLVKEGVGPEQLAAIFA
jgi:hypothetical protein